MGLLDFGDFILCAAKNLAHKTHSGQQKPQLTLLQVNPYLKSFPFYLVHNLSMLVSVLFGCFCHFADHFAPKIYRVQLKGGKKTKDMQSIFSTLLKIDKPIYYTILTIHDYLVTIYCFQLAASHFWITTNQV